MDTTVARGVKRGAAKKRAYNLMLVGLVGVGALWAMLALSRDTSAQAQAGAKGGGSQPVPGGTGTLDCGLDWSAVNSPNPAGVDTSYLNGVAAISASDVWAVGAYYDNAGVSNTLIEHWDGSAWTIMASPNQGTHSNSLKAVAAISANDVWAVGWYFVGSVSSTLIEHWDGSQWNIVSSPNQGTDSNYLKAVAAVSANDVWAVGDYVNNNALYTLTEHWNGSMWNIVNSPNQGTYGSFLAGVTALSANDVWAVGSSSTHNNSSWDLTLTEHWNGSAWSVVTSPNQGTVRNELYAVAAVSANELWAVGSYGSSDQTLTEHWNGSAWSVVASPNQGSDTNYLQGVVAIANNDVWAVGDYFSTSASVDRTLIQHWDGSTWSIVYSPNPTIYSTALYAVAAVSAGDVWAVGDYNTTTTSTSQTLVERYNPCTTGTPTPVPSACPIQYTDVQPGSAFYDYVRCLACRGIVSGYNNSPPCTTGTPCFLPGNNVTRGQMAKFISRAANYQDVIPPNQQTFTDVPPSHTFWLSIERVYLHGVVSGYTDPSRCPSGAPCYLPGNKVTRGQAAHFISKAANYQDPIPPNQQSFTDVPPSNTFWQAIERVNMHGIVGGYQNSPPCTTGTPCFLPGNNISRGQTAKLVSKAFFPDCDTP